MKITTILAGPFILIFILSISLKVISTESTDKANSKFKAQEVTILNPRINRSVAQVGGHVITSREVSLFSVIDKWFVWRSLHPTKEKLQSKERQNFNNELRQLSPDEQLNLLVLNYLVYFEAENFSVAQISAEEIKKQVDEIKLDFKDWNEFTQLEYSLEELNQMVNLCLRSKSFLKFKTESMGFHISDEEAKEYFEKNKNRFGSLEYAKFKESIKEFLSQQQMEIVLKDWFNILRKKYKVKKMKELNEQPSKSQERQST